jgi:hypothetical protein
MRRADCFASCDLYAPRPDGRCRRFEQGVFRNRHFETPWGAAAEIRFKRWAKVEARGNARLLPARLVAAMFRKTSLRSTLTIQAHYDDRTDTRGEAA